jgi:hypothetical protein
MDARTARLGLSGGGGAAVSADLGVHIRNGR